jgi:hypothetical protein
MGTPKEQRNHPKAEVAQQNGNSIWSLATQLEDRNVAEKDAIADQIVEVATIGSLDSLTLLQAVERGGALSTRSRSRGGIDHGSRILFGIETYLSEQETLFKEGVRDVNSKAAYNLLHQTVTTIRGYFLREQLSLETYPHISSFTEVSYRFFGKVAIAKEETPNLVAFQNSEQVAHDPMLVTELERMFLQLKRFGKFGELATIPNQLRDRNSSPTLSFQRRLLMLQRDYKEQWQRGEPDSLLPDVFAKAIQEDYIQSKDKEATLFTSTHGGVNLREIFAADQDQFNLLTSRYIANIPQGDVFWQTLAVSLFLSLPYGGDSRVTAKGNLYNPVVAERIAGFQRWASDILIYSGMGDGPADPHADEDVIGMIDRLDVTALTDFARVMIIGTSDRFYIDQYFGKEIPGAAQSITDIINQNLSALPASLRGWVSEIETNELIKHRLPYIFEDFLQRFPESKNIAAFFEGMSLAAKKLDTKDHITKQAREHWSRADASPLPIEGTVKEREQKRAVIAKKMRSFSSSPGDEAIHGVRVQDGLDTGFSFGFEKVLFYKSTEDSLAFLVNIKGSQFCVFGTILPTGEIRYENVRFEKSDAVLSESVEAIIMGTLEDWYCDNRTDADPDIRTRQVLTDEDLAYIVTSIQSKHGANELESLEFIPKIAQAWNRGYPISPQFRMLIDEARSHTRKEIETEKPSSKNEGTRSEKKEAPDPDAVSDMFERLMRGE